MSLVTTLHVFGAIFLLGGVTAQVLLRPMTLAAAEAPRQALFQLAWRIQVAMVYLGAILVAVTGILLWVGSFKLLTGWLLLGVLLFVAAMGLDGAILAPTIRRARRAAPDRSAEAREELGPSATAAEPGTGRPLDEPADAKKLEPGVGAAAVTVQLVAWFLLAVVVFLMVARPF